MSPAFGTLKEIEAGAAVFIDANIFLYHYAGISEDCTEFLGRCASGELKGTTAAHLVAEVLHRAMIMEAMAKNLAPKSNAKGRAFAAEVDPRAKPGAPSAVVAKLKADPGIVRRLSDHAAAGAAIMDMGVDVIPLTAEILRASGWVRSQSGLLVNDSLTVATMRACGTTALATNDEDFARIDGIRLYRPTGGGK
ncbi:MAG: type II toxin-antitoxin system VapC family toxin [Candidatus Aminicenantales bacterium]